VAGARAVDRPATIARRREQTSPWRFGLARKWVRLDSMRTSGWPTYRSTASCAQRPAVQKPVSPRGHADSRPHGDDMVRGADGVKEAAGPHVAGRLSSPDIAGSRPRFHSRHHPRRQSASASRTTPCRLRPRFGARRRRRPGRGAGPHPAWTGRRPEQRHVGTSHLDVPQIVSAKTGGRPAVASRQAPRASNAFGRRRAPESRPEHARDTGPGCISVASPLLVRSPSRRLRAPPRARAQQVVDTGARAQSHVLET